jgi:HSP20 family protein
MKNQRYDLAPQSWWSPGELHRDFFHLFNLFSDGARDWRRSFLPKMTVEEEKNAYVVKVALPGFDPDQLEAEVVGDFLTVRGEKTSSTLDDGERYIHRERAADHVEETIKLPGRVIPGKVEAKYVHGILTVTLPREAEVKPKTIRVALDK